MNTAINHAINRRILRRPTGIHPNHDGLVSYRQIFINLIKCKTSIFISTIQIVYCQKFLYLIDRTANHGCVVNANCHIIHIVSRQCICSVFHIAVLIIVQGGNCSRPRDIAISIRSRTYFVVIEKIRQNTLFGSASCCILRQIRIGDFQFLQICLFRRCINRFAIGYIGEGVTIVYHYRIAISVKSDRCVGICCGLKRNIIGFVISGKYLIVASLEFADNTNYLRVVVNSVQISNERVASQITKCGSFANADALHRSIFRTSKKRTKGFFCTFQLCIFCGKRRCCNSGKCCSHRQCRNTSDSLFEYSVHFKNSFLKSHTF